MTVSLNIRSVQSIDEIKREDWDRLANSSDVPYDPFLSYDFFAALEHSGSVRAHTGWGPSHLVATDGTKNVVVLCRFI